MRISPLVILLAASCGLPSVPAASFDADEAPLPDTSPGFEVAPDASPRASDFDAPEDLSDRIASFFASNPAQRLYVQLDRPLVRPGESVWIRSVALTHRDLSADPSHAIVLELVDPSGAVAQTKTVAQSMGSAAGEFEIGRGASGGRWTVRAKTSRGATVERPFVVASYAAPRINKTLDFVREAYGPGERVEALVELTRNTGEPLAHTSVRALVVVDGQTVVDEPITTDASGALLVSAVLPTALSSGDGLLTVLVEDGGVTESISRSIPIVLADVSLEFYPEGGDLVGGLPGRVYFEARDADGEPADVAGYVVDDRGTTVAHFRSLHDGLGRFSLAPQAGRPYTAHITEPEGIQATFALPDAAPSGCVLRSYDDVTSTVDAVRVGVHCSAPMDVVVAETFREGLVEATAVHAGPHHEAVVYLAASPSQGAVRVTVFDGAENPVAERLIYRNPGDQLEVSLSTDRQQYGPRDKVVVDIQTQDSTGAPVAAALALSVVNEAVLSFADDEQGHILSQLYLAPEIMSLPDDPAWYFDPEQEDAAAGLDLVMGTRGWRRFAWEPVLRPVSMVATGNWGGPMDGSVAPAERVVDEAELAGQVPMPALFAAKPMEPPAVVDRLQAGEKRKADKWNRRDAPAQGPMLEALEALGYLGDIGGRDGLFGNRERNAGFNRGFAAVQVVREFPKPDYAAGLTGVRSDFRDTIHWDPAVVTDSDGKATLSFYLSDAITGFTLTAEGFGGGMAGRGEASLSSVLPMSLDVKLPEAVSAGDRLTLPVTVRNERSEPMEVALHGTFGPLLRVDQTSSTLAVAPGDAATWWVDVEVAAGRAESAIELVAEAGGLVDTLERTLHVTPPGFPQEWSRSGELAKVERASFVLPDMLDGSLRAEVSWHPSTAASLLTGLEGLISTPGGCFEQTSSTNWPNVAILNYLEAHDGDPRLRMKSAKALAAGYERLVGYQVGGGGFETFGNGPGKEVLSAFGLVQFADMKRVYPVVSDKMMRRDATYLLAQRDGKGGYRNSGTSSHGFGSAPAAVSDAFITYALAAYGETALQAELSHAAKIAQTTQDPYVLALHARTLRLLGHRGAEPALERLVAMQTEEGSFPGAESSITHSYEANLLVESTALATLALVEAMADGQRSHRVAADRAADWLVANRDGRGTWGATQATALALGALSQHAEVSRAPSTGGSLELVVNGTVVGQLDYQAGQLEPLQMGGWEDLLASGHNDVVLRHQGDTPLPFTLDVGWSTSDPLPSEHAELALEISVEHHEISMGETTRLTAIVQNRTGRVVHSPIARIGLPAGLEAQTWQLQELQDAGVIAFFETRPREVTLYWQGVHASDAHEVGLDLVAMVPGVFTAPASSAYPYYNDDDKAWQRGAQVRITP